MKPYFAYPCKILSGIAMLVVLLWLILGAAFVYSQQKQLSKTVLQQNANDNSDQSSYPFDNTGEQTDTNFNIFSTEYLQQEFADIPCSSILLKHHTSHVSDAFLIIPGESFSPPPEWL